MADQTAVETAHVMTDSTVTLAPGGRRGWARILLGRDAVMIYLLLLTLLWASLTIRNFASPVTVGFLLLDVIPTLLIALPMTLIIITGEIDLSVASIAGLTSAVLGVLWAGGMNITLAILLSVLIATVAGAANGGLIAYLGLPSLAVANFPSALTSFVTSKLGGTGIPTVMIGVLAIVVVFGVVLHATPFGRTLFAIGYSPSAARFVGVDVARSKFYLYLASGFVSGLAGVFWTLRYSSARSDNASGLELAVIAAVLLGGVSIFGGKGSIPGAVAGVLLIGVINYALRLGRVSDVVLIIVTGTLLIISVVAPSVGAALRAWRRRIKVRRAMEAATTTTGG